MTPNQTVDDSMLASSCLTLYLSGLDASDHCVGMRQVGLPRLAKRFGISISHRLYVDFSVGIPTWH